MKEKQILQHVINKCDVEILNHKCDYVGVQFSKANGYYFLNEELHITYDGGSTGKSLKEIKLILLPLSDLTREDINSFSVDVRLALRELNSEKLLSRACYYELQWLLENHYDIHNLIEKGLAIDINTLNK